MSLNSDLTEYCDTTFKTAWTERDGTVVPSDASVKLSNDGVNIEATVLYADLSYSTALVDAKSKAFAAEIYKTYLYCAGRIIRNEGGAITAYDGDRIMAVYIGDLKNSSAAKTALKINSAVHDIINPSIKRNYRNQNYEVKQQIGIDTSNLLVAKTGIRGSNDLVWVGRAANYAAKLCDLKTKPTYITEAVYKKLSEETKFSNGVNMWEERSWTAMDNKKIYRSSYKWTF